MLKHALLKRLTGIILCISIENIKLRTQFNLHYDGVIVSVPNHTSFKGTLIMGKTPIITLINSGITTHKHRQLQVTIEPSTMTKTVLYSKL